MVAADALGIAVVARVLESDAALWRNRARGLAAVPAPLERAIISQLRSPCEAFPTRPYCDGATAVNWPSDQKGAAMPRSRSSAAGAC
jgi:hypothetical protein